MQHLSNQILPAIAHSRGGRVSSPELRHSLQLCEDFAGLESDTDRYDLLLLVKRAGAAAGFTSKMVQLMDYYLAFTRDNDWEQGARPIVYQSLTKTALDLGVTERQIQRLEQSLFEAGAITWCDSGNHRRYGQRCPQTGRILYAFGIDLTPLAYLKPQLEAKLQEKDLYDRSWLETKRQISWYRRQICGTFAEAEEGGYAARLTSFAAQYEKLAGPIRTYTKLEALRTLLAEHKALYDQILSQLEEETGGGGGGIPKEESSMNDTTVVHYNSTNQESFNELNSRPKANCFQESVPQPPSAKGNNGAGREAVITSGKAETSSDKGDPILATGLQHITLKQALNAASERFRAHIPLELRAMNWADLVEAAYRLKPELHISQQSWADACAILGRNGAAICLLLTDQATLREVDPVQKPGAYFRSMVKRAKSKQLHLHSSVFGILKREEGISNRILKLD